MNHAHIDYGLNLKYIYLDLHFLIELSEFVEIDIWEYFC
jgi:hypothetical protein